MNRASYYTKEDEHSFTFKVTSGESGVFWHYSILVECGATSDKDKILQFDETFNIDKHFMELADGPEQTMLH